MTPTSLTVTELAGAIRDRRLSAREAMQAHLKRIEAVNPLINAIVTLDTKSALDQAERADRAIADGEALGPLHGVPFTLKDMHETAGMRTTFGLRALADNVPSEDGVIAARLKRAGGILIGKTNMAMSIQTNSELFGRTSNPYDTGRASGGSSGGAAAAVAARIVPFDIGTDLSGSIRMPCHLCGVLGLKPTPQRIPLTGMIWGAPGIPRPDRVLGAAGPIARSAEDVDLLFRVLAGSDPRDPDVPPVPVRAVQRKGPASLRVAIAPSIEGIRIANGVSDAVRDVGERLARAGAHVEERALPFSFEDLLAGFRRLIVATFAGMGAANAPPGSPPAAMALPSALDFFGALAEREQFIMKIESFLSSYDAFICPPTIVAAFPHCERGAPIDVDGTPVSSSTVDHPALLATYTGAPSIVVPVRLDENGLPLAVQCIARRFHDEELIGIAATIEDVVGPLPAPKVETQRPPSCTL